MSFVERLRAEAELAEKTTVFMEDAEQVADTMAAIELLRGAADEIDQLRGAVDVVLDWEFTCKDDGAHEALKQTVRALVGASGPGGEPRG